MTYATHGLLCRLSLVFIVVLASVTSVLPQELPPKEMTRIKKLEDSLLSPCCYGEPVSRHMSDISFQMRKEITEKVLAGQSDREILDYYKGLYGERVLVEPDGCKKVILYSLPVLISLMGLAVVLLFLRQALNRHSHRMEKGSQEKRIDTRIAEAIRSATDA